MHVRNRCGSLSITTPVSLLENEFVVRSVLHWQVSLAAVNHIYLQKSKDSLKACFENVNIVHISFSELCTKFWWIQLIRIYTVQGTKIFQYCTCPAGQVTYNIHSSCKHMHLSLKSICNKEHKRVIFNMTSSSNSSQSTQPTG